MYRLRAACKLDIEHRRNATESQIRIVVADDSPWTRECLRKLLRSHKDLMVIAEAASGKEALVQVGENRPDVLVMDLHMPDMCGLAALGNLKNARRSNTAVILMSTDTSAEYRRQALSLGAFGFVHKEDLGALPEMIRKAARSLT